MMKAEIKEKWLAALRSGEYKQGQSYLRLGDEFCCLGVLCDLHAKAKGRKWEATQESFGMSYLDADTVLPEEVSRWAGLEWDDPQYHDSRGNFQDLTTQNDDGKSFKQIANIIERYF